MRLPRLLHDFAAAITMLRAMFARARATYCYVDDADVAALPSA